MERGEVAAGCQGPLYPSEIARLKDEALRSRDPALLTLLGDAYQGNRSAISDVGQAYRWYLLAAVRGDPRAMQRLSELYRGGSGAPLDRARALGYARLAQRLAVPGSKTASDAAQASASLGSSLAGEELALADKFAADLESQLRQQGAVPPAGEPAAVPGSSNAAAGQGGITLRERAAQPMPGPAIPGMAAVPGAPPPAR
ncbi:MAG: sel1 repeat family protein [Comamonadaceae bacterium]|nr:MAG: sel1 repeat family protein [Comamonadaceae bacterium]